MKSLDKESFLLLLKLRPQWLMGRQIIYDGKTVGILDISVSGDYLHLENSDTPATEWVPVSSIGDSVVIDIIDFSMDTGKDPFTVLSITRWIESLEKSVGQPDSEQSKSLFEIVAALNKEMLALNLKFKDFLTLHVNFTRSELLALNLKFKEMELKEKNYERD